VPNQKPKKDEIEITLFGPGFGESVVVHCGLDQWMIVDSCRMGKEQQPAALRYLRSIDVDPSTAVKRIVATHWHDDHTKGLSEIVEACPSAQFVCASVMLEKEFIQLLQLQNDDKLLASDTSEFDRIFNYFRQSGQLEDRANFPIRFAAPNRRIWFRAAGGDDEPSCEIFSLSPSDMATSTWLASLREILKPDQNNRKRVIPSRPNQISVALFLKMDNLSVLLGADLEEENNQAGGWQVIAESNERPQDKASAHKIPHHGSSNGHCDAVWEKMLENNPVAILAPYNKGRKLPSKEDAERILKLTNRAYITSDLKGRSIRGATGSVNRTINEIAKRINVLDNEEGFVRLRRSASIPASNWTVEKFGKARDLATLYA
jgi:beta-lactamase superfamily II metal-dependent hydrolase